MISARANPFEYGGANDLPPEMIVDYYIEDFNYSRFIQSNRNILLVGERGCGKSMTLIYNSWPIQQLKAGTAGMSAPGDFIGVYVPCNTPLIHRHEHTLLPPLQAFALSEHQFALSLAYSIAATLSGDRDLLGDVDCGRLRTRIEYVLDAELPKGASLFQEIMEFVQLASLRTQQAVNSRETPEISYDRTYSFASLIVPLLGLTRSIPRLRHSHFMLLVDDAHDLNALQLQALSSWIAYRDHALFSFKVALANLARRQLRTASGGSILEGHDYIRLDMVQPFHNELSNFGRFSRRLIEKRLRRFSLNRSPEEFFPQSAQLEAELAAAEEAVRSEARARFGNDSRRVSDHVYKYSRAHFFRTRPAKANRPEYSGFSTLVYLSTGVVRNLLYPCYWMYDKMLSLASDEPCAPGEITVIPPTVQAEIILERSRKLWDWLRDGIDSSIVGCSREDAVRCYQLLDQLAVHFRERLLKHRSEPRANSFTVSSQTDVLMGQLTRVFDILREAQLLYVRSGPAKEKGQREWYYIPNRMLWPERGLDPEGQHARVSLKAADLWAAADKNQTIPFQDDREGDVGLFNESV